MPGDVGLPTCGVSHATFNGRPIVAEGGRIASRATASQGTRWRWERGEAETVAAGTGGVADYVVAAAGDADATRYRVTFEDAAGEPVAGCVYTLRLVRWQLARFGGGGVVSGGDVAADGTKVFRSTTSGATRYDDETGRFVPLVPAHLPERYRLPWNGAGVYEVLVAPSDSDVIYVAYDTGDALEGGVFFRSRDGGASFEAVLVERSFAAARGTTARQQHHGAIDPRTPDHVLLGDEEGLWRTVDGGATWAEVESLPRPRGNPRGFAGVAFNRSSPVTEGRTSEVIVSTGSDYFRSTDGGATFADISAGGPDRRATMAAFDARGAYYVSENGLWRYEEGSWMELPVPGANNLRFAVDGERILVGRQQNLNFTRSTDRGATWSEEQLGRTRFRSADGIPWHDAPAGADAATTGWLLDPVTRRVWVTGEPRGVASVDFDAAFAAIPGDLAVDTHAVGLEQACMNAMVLPPGSSHVHAVLEELGYAQLPRDGAGYPTVVDGFDIDVSGWGLDRSSEDPRFLARVFADGRGEVARSGWSGDDGASWTRFEGTLPFDRAPGTTLAYAGRDAIVLVPAGSEEGVERAPLVTRDRGATWTPMDLGVPWTEARVRGIHEGAQRHRRVVVADPEAIGTFSFFSSSDDPELQGIWRSEDGGVQWRRVHAGLPPAPEEWRGGVTLRSPVTGHLWLGSGPTPPDGVEGPGKLYRSLDEGETLEALPGVGEVARFGFGAPAPGGSGYPVLFLAGYVGGVPGVWASPDADAAAPRWVFLGPFPAGRPQLPVDLLGDPDQPGRVWVALGCAGAAVGEFAELL